MIEMIISTRGKEEGEEEREEKEEEEEEFLCSQFLTLIVWLSNLYFLESKIKAIVSLKRVSGLLDEGLTV